MFEVYNCKDCVKYKEDETILIGENKVFIYYINSGCQEIIYNPIDIAVSKKLKLFIKDCIKCQLKKEDIIFLWLDRTNDFGFDIDKNIELIYDLLLFDTDIHLLV